MLDESKAPLYKWFTGGLTNISYNCIDRHVDEGRGKDIAVIYESVYTKRGRIIKYEDLLYKVSRFARVLSN